MNKIYFFLFIYLAVQTSCFLKSGTSTKTNYSVNYQLSRSFEMIDTVSIKTTIGKDVYISFPVYYYYDIQWIDSVEERNHYYNTIIDTIYWSNDSFYFINCDKLKLFATYFTEDSVELNEVRLEYIDTLFNTLLIPEKRHVGRDEIRKFNILSRWDNKDNLRGMEEENVWCRRLWLDRAFLPIKSTVCYSGGDIIQLEKVN